MSPTTKFSKFLWEAPLSLLEPRPQFTGSLGPLTPQVPLPQKV